MKHALIVGIDKYRHSKVNNLRGCVNDARAMASLASKYNFTNIQVLTDRSASKQAIINELTRLFKTAKKGDYILYYHSGHGTQVDDKNHDEIDMYDEVLVAHDFSPNKPRTYILDDEFQKIISIRESKRLKVDIIIDSCHSGTMSDATGQKSVPFKQDNKYYTRQFGRHASHSHEQEVFNVSPEYTPGNELWTPSLLPKKDILLWTDPSSKKCLTCDENGVFTHLRDKSGKGNHIIPGNMVEIVSGEHTQNNMSMLSLSGDNFLTTTKPIDMENCSIFMIGTAGEVFHHTQSIISTSNTAVSWQLQANNSSRFSGCFNQTGVNFKGRVRGDAGLYEGPHQGPALYEITLSKSKKDIIVGVNAHRDLHKKISYDTTIPSSNLQFFSNRTKTKLLPGKLGEVLIVQGEIDESTRTKIEGYFCYKWGLRNYMDNNHTHKMYAPIVPNEMDYLLIAACNEGELAYENVVLDPYGSGTREYRGLLSYAIEKWSYNKINSLSTWQDLLPRIQQEIDELRDGKPSQTISYVGSPKQLSKPVLGGKR